MTRRKDPLASLRPNAVIRARLYFRWPAKTTQFSSDVSVNGHADLGDFVPGRDVMQAEVSRF